MGKLIIDPQDRRWGGYVPWFFRHGDFTVTGNLLLFFERVSQRLYRLFFHNESVIQNLNHFGAIIESRSLQRYRFKWEYTQGDASLANSIQNFFDPKSEKGSNLLLTHIASHQSFSWVKGRLNPFIRRHAIHAGRKAFLGSVFHEWASVPARSCAGNKVGTILLRGGSSIGERRSRQNAGPRHRC
jgi:hypothetical protein